MKKFIYFLWLAVYITVGGIILHFNGAGVSFWTNALGMCSALVIGVFIGLNYKQEDDNDCLSD